MDAIGAMDEAHHYALLLNEWANDTSKNAPQFTADCRTIAAMIVGHIEAYGALIERNCTLRSDLESARRTISAQQRIIQEQQAQLAAKR